MLKFFQNTQTNFWNMIKKPILRDALLIGFGMAGARLTSFIFRYLALRILDVAEYGELALFINGFQVLTPFVGFHVGHALAVSYSSKSEKENAGLTKASILICFFMSLIITPISFILFKNYQINIQMAILIFFGFFSTSLLIISQGVMRGLIKPFNIALLEWSTSLGRVIFLFGFIALGVFSIKGPQYAFLFGSIFGGGVSILFLIKYKILNLLKLVTLNEIKPFINKIFNFSIYIVFAQSLTFSIHYLSRLSLSRFSFEQVGIYDSALLLYSILQVGISGVGLAVVPYASKRSQLGKKFILPIRKILFLYIPISIIILIIIRTQFFSSILSFLRLDDYVSSLPIFMILLLVSPLELIFTTGSNILIGQDRTKDYFKTVLFVLPFHFILVWTAGKIIGEIGVAVVSIFTYLFLAWRTNCLLKK